MTHPYQQRIARCGEHMRHLGIDVLLLTKPSNMFYLTGDGCLCAYAMITADGKVALGVPVTDIEDEHWEDTANLQFARQIPGFDVVNNIMLCQRSLITGAAYHRRKSVKLACTIADLAGSEEIQSAHYPRDCYYPCDARSDCYYFVSITALALITCR
jgi:hypothetical protein